MKKIIIFGWHFKSIPGVSENEFMLSKCYFDEPIYLEDYTLYLCSHPKNKNDNPDSITNPFLKEINCVLSNHDECEVLIYLHENPWNKGLKKAQNRCVWEVLSGGWIYGDEGIVLKRTGSFREVIINDLPWDVFWKKFYVFKEKLKQDFIRLYYPIIVDIQGLKRSNYIDKKYLAIVKDRISIYEDEIENYKKENDKKEVREIFSVFKDLPPYIEQLNKCMKKIIKGVLINDDDVPEFKPNELFKEQS